MIFLQRYYTYNFHQIYKKASTALVLNQIDANWNPDLQNAKITQLYQLVVAVATIFALKHGWRLTVISSKLFPVE